MRAFLHLQLKLSLTTYDYFHTKKLRFGAGSKLFYFLLIIRIWIQQINSYPYRSESETRRTAYASFHLYSNPELLFVLKDYVVFSSEQKRHRKVLTL